MTNVNKELPYGIPYIELTDRGRRISFQKDCLEDVSIIRKVNEGEWEKLSTHIRSPYINEEAFPEGTKLSYNIDLTPANSNRRYQLEARL